MKKILIAEDDLFLANAYKAKFSKAGFAIDIVENGDEVMQKLDSFHPDALLLDLMMPKKDGFSVLADLRKDPKWAKLPVIVATNLGQKEDLDRAMSLGATSFVVKTNLSLSELVDKINVQLSHPAP